MENRAGIFPDLKPKIIYTLMSVMEWNPYAAFFRSLREVNIIEHAKVTISHNPSSDQRVYNAPTSEEVAGILLNNSDSAATNSPDIIVYGNCKGPFGI